MCSSSSASARRGGELATRCSNRRCVVHHSLARCTATHRGRAHVPVSARWHPADAREYRSQTCAAQLAGGDATLMQEGTTRSRTLAGDAVANLVLHLVSVRVQRVLVIRALLLRGRPSVGRPRRPSPRALRGCGAPRTPWRPAGWAAGTGPHRVQGEKWGCQRPAPVCRFGADRRGLPSPNGSLPLRSPPLVTARDCCLPSDLRRCSPPRQLAGCRACGGRPYAPAGRAGGCAPCRTSGSTPWFSAVRVIRRC